MSVIFEFELFIFLMKLDTNIWNKKRIVILILMRLLNKEELYATKIL